MATKTIHGDQARESFLAGARALYSAVKTTYGPKGLNVIIDTDGEPRVTHDGVTVAEAVILKDAKESVGAEFIKRAARRMNRYAGDGTTTVTVLTYHMIEEANDLIEKGYSPMDIKAGMESAGLEALEFIQTCAIDVKEGSDTIRKIASISAANEAIGELIGGVFKAVGRNGAIAVEPTVAPVTSSEVMNGYVLNSGVNIAEFMTDAQRQLAEYEDVAVIITDEKIRSSDQFIGLFNKALDSGKSNFLFVAEDFEDEPLGVLYNNMKQGAFNILPLSAPLLGKRRSEILGDLATLTGAKLISNSTGVTFKNATAQAIGHVSRVESSVDKTTLIRDDAEQDEKINARIEELESKIADKETEQEDRDWYRNRLAALQGKVAVIKVGGATKVEAGERKDRVDDAVAAAKAALSEGIVAGGGVTLLDAAGIIKTDGVGGFAAGRKAVKHALMAPVQIIATNAGLSASETVDVSGLGVGIDVTRPERGPVDMVQNGVIDPAMVTKQAVELAISIASTAITLGAIIIKEDK